MSENYIGVKIIKAGPCSLGEYNKKRGWIIPDNEDPERPGYIVHYPDGYTSWSPKEIFESAYFPMGHKAGLAVNEDAITQEMVDAFMGELEVTQIDPKTALIKAETKTGFVQYEVSSCVDPKNFDINIGEQIGRERIQNNLWKCLGFVLQWGKFGLKKTSGQ